MTAITLVGDKKFSHPPPSLWPQIIVNQAFYSGFLHTYSKDFILRISFLGDKKCCHHFPHKSLPIGPFVRDIFKGILRILLKVDKKHCHCPPSFPQQITVKPDRDYSQLLFWTFVNETDARVPNFLNVEGFHALLLRNDPTLPPVFFEIFL